MSTLGWTGTGADGDCNDINYGMGSKYTLSEPAHIVGFFMYCDPGPDTGSKAFRVAVYANNAGALGALKGVSPEVTIPEDPPGGWYRFPLNKSIDLLPGDYWLMLLYGAGPGYGGVSHHNESSSGPGMYYTATFWTYSATSNPPDPGPSLTLTGATSCIALYAEYRAASLGRMKSGLLLRDDFSTDTSGSYDGYVGSLSVSAGNLVLASQDEHLVRTGGVKLCKCVTTNSPVTSTRFVGPGLYQSNDFSAAANVDGYEACCTNTAWYNGWRVTDATRAASWSDATGMPTSTMVMRLYLDATGVQFRYGETALSDSTHFNDTTYTDPGYPGATIGSGSNCKLDYIDARTSHEMKCYGLPSGWKFQVTDGTTTATATESGGVATVDAGAVLFPCTEVRVLNGSDVEQVHILAATLADMGGGDEFHYDAMPNKKGPLLLVPTPVPPTGSFITGGW